MGEGDILLLFQTARETSTTTSGLFGGEVRTTSMLFSHGILSRNVFGGALVEQVVICPRVSQNALRSSPRSLSMGMKNHTR